MSPTETTTFPAPAIDPLLPSPGKWEQEYRAFRRLLPALLPNYRGQYVAIHEGQVIGHGTDKLNVALEAFERIGNTPIHVGLVAEDPEPVLRTVCAASHWQIKQFRVEVHAALRLA